MRVEDVAARAGSDLRVRFEGVSAPDARHNRRQTAPARTGLVMAVLVVVVAVGLTAILRSTRMSPTAAGESDGPMWQRISIETAFGARAVIGRVSAVRHGFVATGYRPTKSGASNRLGARYRLLIWTSPDGARWSAVPTRGVPASEHPDGSEVVESSSGYLLVRRSNDGFSTWVSDDLRIWVRGESFRGVNAMDVRAVDPDQRSARVDASGAGTSAFEAWTLRTDGVGPGAYVGYVSDGSGRRWRPKVGGLLLQQPSGAVTGFPPSVQLGDRWISLPTQGTGGRRILYQSLDDVHWSWLASNAPSLIDDLVGDQAGTRALAIEYQADRTLGDRVWSTRDGARWSEVGSFAQRYPNMTVDRLVQAGDWWVLGGVSKGKLATPTMLATRDFVHWVAFDVSKSSRTASVPALAAHGDRVIGLTPEGSELVIWHRPRSAERSRR